MTTLLQAAAAAKPLRRRVLIVEDNPLNMKLFAAMIGAQGHEVLQAANGSAALDLAHRGHPDLIVMDLQLPDMSGLDVADTLKAAGDTQAIPIIATSAYAAQGDEASIRAHGCEGFMAKPIAIGEFVELIEAFLARPAALPVL